MADQALDNKPKNSNDPTNQTDVLRLIKTKELSYQAEPSSKIDPTLLGVAGAAGAGATGLAAKVALYMNLELAKRQESESQRRVAGDLMGGPAATGAATSRKFFMQAVENQLQHSNNKAWWKSLNSDEVKDLSLRALKYRLLDIPWKANSTDAAATFKDANIPSTKVDSKGTPLTADTAKADWEATDKRVENFINRYYSGDFTEAESIDAKTDHKTKGNSIWLRAQEALKAAKEGALGFIQPPRMEKALEDAKNGADDPVLKEKMDSANTGADGG